MDQRRGPTCKGSACRSRFFPMPPDDVIAQCASDSESGSRHTLLVLPQGWTRCRRQSSETIL